MRKITYTNSANGLSAEFSSDDPLMHLNLKSFDGCSVGANAVTYSPVESDGQRTVSVNLSARTIVLSVEIAGKADGKYSREHALRRMGEIMRVFVPLHDGVLTWTDGENTRTINCRTVEAPRFSEMLPFMFSASISLTADYPYWEDIVEHSVELHGGEVNTVVENDCGIAVPVRIDVPTGGSQPLIYSRTAGAGVAFAIAPEQDCTVDTKECTVTLADGTFANHLLSAQSSYFKVLPGKNEIITLGVGSGNDKAVLRWKNLYTGVF